MKKILLFLMVALVAATGITALREPEEVIAKQADEPVTVELVVPDGVVNTDAIKAGIEDKKMLEDVIVLPEEVIIRPKVWNVGFVTVDLNVRSKPSTKGKKITTLPKNTEIRWRVYNDNWAYILLGKKEYYVAAEFVADQPVAEPLYRYSDTCIPQYSGFKTWMSYRALTSTSSPQYKLQKYATTDANGFRLVDGRYCIAVGTGTRAKVGDIGELHLANGTVIPMIIGDIKADIHTDSANLITVYSNCASEFIVDSRCLNSTVKRMGDCSYLCDEWQSRVTVIRLYGVNNFD